MKRSEPALLDILRSPDSARPLRRSEGALVTEDGAESYPILAGVPVLLGSASVFTAAALAADRQAAPDWAGRLRSVLKRALPSLSHNLVARRNYAGLRELLHAEGHDAAPRVLVVGGSIAGEGIGELLNDPGLRLVETDVALGPRTAVVCDAHQLPFADGSFDCAVCQAVLEHVADPPRVVSELHRVLRPGGLVYSEIPFMQQVHEGAHDFTRYTLSGHRRLFRDFSELDSGATAGPGMALGWAIRSFCLGFAGDRHRLRAAINLLVTLTAFWLKYLDRSLLSHPAGLDGASGTYFLGRSSERPRSDSDVIAAYRGANRGFSLVR